MTRPTPATAAELRARMHASTRRALIFWASRWALGFAGAVGIVLYTGEHHWLPLAAGAVALVSLLIIAINWSGMNKRVKAAEAAESGGPAR